MTKQEEILEAVKSLCSAVRSESGGWLSGSGYAIAATDRAREKAHQLICRHPEATIGVIADLLNAAEATHAD